MNIVDRYKTPASEEQMKFALGRHFSGNRLAFTLAQTYLETAKWQSIYNYNVGNISASESFSGQAYRPHWYTVDANSSANLRELHEAMLQGKVPTAFRSYGSLREGVDAYALMMKQRFPEILTAADSGDPQQVADAIMVKYCRIKADGSPCFQEAEVSSLRSLAIRFGANVQEKPRFGWRKMLVFTAVGAGAWWLWRSGQPDVASYRLAARRGEENMRATRARMRTA